MYRANIGRASAGDIDNTPLIERVLTLRQEKAALLGYANFAEVSMASKVRFLRVARVV
jgi:oligopeptidase A